MTVLPVPSIPAATQKAIGSTPPAGEDGNGLPADTITPYSGIYDSNGKLPSVPDPGMTFIAHA